MEKLITELFDFIESSPTAFHTVETTRRLLTGAGFTELSETEPWKLSPGKGYFTTRNMLCYCLSLSQKGFSRLFRCCAPWRFSLL